MPGPDLIPLTGFPSYPDEEMRRRAAEFRAEMGRRRSVRQFSDRPVPRQVVEECIATAASAPSGANRQPWRFVVVSDPAVKRRLREGAEREEQDFYSRRAPAEWLEALAPIGTDEHKPFLEAAPYLIVIFAEQYEPLPDGTTRKNYYVPESVGIATGLLIAALQRSGLACLTHTPAPMRFLNQILDRPAHEKPYLILVVGHPASDALVPRLDKKPVEAVTTFL